MSRACLGCKKPLATQAHDELCTKCVRQSGHGPVRTQKAERLERIVKAIASDPDISGSALEERFGCSGSTIKLARQLLAERRGAA